MALGAHLRDASGALAKADVLRARLPRDIRPGESVTIGAEFVLPSLPGRYALDLDLVDEGLVWFSAQGSASVLLPAEVS